MKKITRRSQDQMTKREPARSPRNGKLDVSYVGIEALYPDGVWRLVGWEARPKNLKAQEIIKRWEKRTGARSMVWERFRLSSYYYDASV
jgi:hypothetical protein